MISYSFTDVIIIIPNDHKDEIEQQLSKRYNIKMEFVTVAHDKDLGTAESLKHMSKKITVRFDFFSYLKSKYFNQIFSLIE